MKPQIPLCISTMAQRACMGTFVMCLVANWLFGCSISMNTVSLITIVLLGCAMMGTTTHLGKPGRILGALRNPTSHLTLEMLTCIPVAITYLIIAANGFLYIMPPVALITIEVIGLAASVAFIWVTALAYHMKARPAWSTPFTPLNFMLTFLSCGSLGACFAIALSGQAIPVGFFAVAAVLLVASISGQLFFTYYVGHVGYRVDIKAFAKGNRTVYVWWLVLGVAASLIGLIVMAFAPASTLISGITSICNAISLALWQAFFFISGKEVWYFPQYERDLRPDYF